jgi:predicted ATPase
MGADMYFFEVSLENYASFKSSGVVSFGPGINFIVGQNNTGKSALLRSLRPNFQDNRYRDSDAFRSEDTIQSRQHIKIVFNPSEFVGTSKRTGWRFYWPATDPISASRSLDEFLSSNSWTASIVRRENEFNLVEPPYGVNHGNSFAIFTYINGELSFLGFSSLPEIQLSQFLTHRYNETVFWFNAERYNVGRCPIAMQGELAPDASNLPAVLMRMSGNQGDLFRTLIQHMRDIFPTVRNLSITSPEHSTDLEILVWPVLEQRHKSLATTLMESGTGLSQVLAILTAAMTREQAVIIIDELSSFLHPAAAKALVRILETHYPEHQYVISTHSPEVITACAPSSIHLVTKAGFKSTVTKLDVNEVEHLRLMTGELGVTLTDVFASDRIIWVEGPTEEAAFPYIFEQTRDESSSERAQRSPQFTAVVATGDFTAKRTRHDLIFDIYSRLSSSVAALPGAATFAFDAEDMTVDQKRDLKKHANGRLTFLPRRMFECYLLHPAAISAVINSKLTGDEVNASAVEVFILENGGEKKYKAADKWDGDFRNPEWLNSVDAAVLLHDLFNTVTDARLEFSKRTHSFGIIKEILAINPEFADELIQFVKDLVALSRSASQ